MEQVKLLSMTAVLTLLIWATADSLVNDTRNLRVRVEPYPRGNPDLVMEIPPPAEQAYVEMEIAGPRKVVEDLASRETLKLRVPVVDRPVGAGELTLDNKELLRREIQTQWREDPRLNVGAITPASVPLTVDRWVRQPFELTLGRLRLNYDQPPQLNRSNVEVRLRESALNRIVQEAGRPAIDLSDEIERQLKKSDVVVGKRIEFPVPIDASRFGPGATVEPPVLEGTAIVADQRVVKEIPTVPIKLVVSFAGLKRPLQPVGRDGAPINLVAQTIRVSGPPEDVLKLERGETKAFGLIQLKEAELEKPGDFRAWTPEFILPANLTLADPPVPVEFRLAEVPPDAGG
ncbi:MAG: hypothetical protein J5J06_02360 [Phycisphaerae bacterium]|nr:hypothetical protein [Phycisphaerae bacterium]